MDLVEVATDESGIPGSLVAIDVLQADIVVRLGVHVGDGAHERELALDESGVHRRYGRSDMALVGDELAKGVGEEPELGGLGVGRLGLVVGDDALHVLRDSGLLVGEVGLGISLGEVLLVLARHLKDGLFEEIA